MGFWEAVASAGLYTNNKSAPRSRLITTPTPHHYQQCQSTRGKTTKNDTANDGKYSNSPVASGFKTAGFTI